MNYQDALDFLYGQLPMFQRVGPAAFKKDLTNTFALTNHLGEPQRTFKSIHIAGTNGKGSSANLISSILIEAGFKVGLYTSPHLRSFTERIRVNGQEIPEKRVVQFVENNLEFIRELKPSFFEMTVAMAFDHFRNEAVDIAVIEVGLGGRLDSTNVIDPEICLITNIGFDHMEFLGDTIPEIAGEKAGIIKKGVPVVISEYDHESFPVFENKALELNSPLHKAWELELAYFGMEDPQTFFKEVRSQSPLKGKKQEENLKGALCLLNQIGKKGFPISKDDLTRGLKNLSRNTGFRGRWEILSQEPTIVCDCAHNKEGIQSIQPLINELPGNLHVVWGTVADKNFSDALKLMPKEAEYYFCAPNIPRKLDEKILREEGQKLGYKGSAYGSVRIALEQAKLNAQKGDSIFIGGSTFVVAEVV